MNFVNFGNVHCESLNTKDINYISLNNFNIIYNTGSITNYNITFKSNFNFLYSSNDYIQSGELIFGDQTFYNSIHDLNAFHEDNNITLYDNITDRYLLINGTSNYPTDQQSNNGISGGNNQIKFIDSVHKDTIENTSRKTSHNAGNGATIYHYTIRTTGDSILTVSDAVKSGEPFELKFPYTKIFCYKKVYGLTESFNIYNNTLNNINCNKINNINTCTISDSISVYNDLIIKDITGTEKNTFEQKIYDMLFPINSIKIFHDYKGTEIIRDYDNSEFEFNEFEFNTKNIKCRWTIINHTYTGLLHTTDSKENSLKLTFDESEQDYFYNISVSHYHNMYLVSTSKKLIGGASEFAYDQSDYDFHGKNSGLICTYSNYLTYKMSLPNYYSIYLYRRIA